MGSNGTLVDGELRPSSYSDHISCLLVYAMKMNILFPTSYAIILSHHVAMSNYIAKQKSYLPLKVYYRMWR